MMEGPGGRPLERERQPPSQLVTLIEGVYQAAASVREVLKSERTRFKASGIDEVKVDALGGCRITAEQSVLLASFKVSHDLVDALEARLEDVFGFLEKLPRTNPAEVQLAKKTTKTTITTLQRELLARMGQDEDGPLLCASLLYRVIRNGELGGLGNPRLIQALLNSDTIITPSLLGDPGKNLSCYGLAIDQVVLGADMRRSLESRYRLVGAMIAEELRSKLGQCCVLMHVNGGPMVAEMCALEILKDVPGFKPERVRLALIDTDPSAVAIVKAKLEQLFPNEAQRPILSYTHGSFLTPAHEVATGELPPVAIPSPRNIADPTFTRLAANCVLMIGGPDYLLPQFVDIAEGQVLPFVDQRLPTQRWALHNAAEGALVVYTNFKKTVPSPQPSDKTHRPRHRVLWCVCKWPLQVETEEQWLSNPCSDLLVHRLDLSRHGKPAAQEGLRTYEDLIPGAEFRHLRPSEFGFTTDRTGLNLITIIRKGQEGAANLPPATDMVRRAILGTANGTYADAYSIAGFVRNYRLYAMSDWGNLPPTAPAAKFFDPALETVARYFYAKLRSETGENEQDAVFAVAMLKSKANRGNPLAIHSALAAKTGIPELREISPEELQPLTGIDEGFPPFGLQSQPGKERFTSISFIDVALLDLPHVWTPLDHGEHRLVWVPHHLFGSLGDDPTLEFEG